MSWRCVRCGCEVIRGEDCKYCPEIDKQARKVISLGKERLRDELLVALVNVGSMGSSKENAVECFDMVDLLMKERERRYE